MSHGEHINTMLPCRQTSSILANKLQYLNLDDTRSTSKGLRVLCEKVDFHRTGAYHHHNNRFCVFSWYCMGCFLLFIRLVMCLIDPTNCFSNLYILKLLDAAADGTERSTV